MDEIDKAMRDVYNSLSKLPGEHHTIQIKYHHQDVEEADPELKERRENEGLSYFSPSIIHGQTSREDCFYCEVPLIEETNFAREKSTGDVWRTFYSCPKCGVHYDIPISQDEQIKMDERMRGNRILEMALD